MGDGRALKHNVPAGTYLEVYRHDSPVWTLELLQGGGGNADTLNTLIYIESISDIYTLSYENKSKEIKMLKKRIPISLTFNKFTNK